MNYNFDSLENFEKSLEEIDFLIKKVQKETEKELYQDNIYLKSALLLLVSKFEAFLENSILDYNSEINNLKLTNDKIPTALKINHVSNFFDEKKITEKMKHKHKYNEVCEELGELSKLFATSNNFSSIKISNKFNYGKHGGDEVEKLFEKIGLDEIFNKITIFNDVKTMDTMDNESEKQKVDFKGEINSITLIRNNILHQDTDRMSFTIKELTGYRNHFKQFSAQLIEVLQKMLLDIR